MADVGYIALAVASIGVYWWRHLRPQPRLQFTAGDLFSPDAEVALHVASHEARARRRALSSLHVLYGLIQDDAVVAAIIDAGASAEALEDRVLAALDAQPDDHDDAGILLGRIAGLAHHLGRRAGCADLWAGLRDSPAARVLEDARVDRGAVLFVLCHGGRAPDVTLPDQRDVFVVLRNDHYTTQRFVSELLREVFGLAAPRAEELMLTVHTEGRGVIGRFTAAEARDRITAARDRARGEAFPLWIGVEPA